MGTIKLALVVPYSKIGRIPREQEHQINDPYSNWILALGGEQIPLPWLQLRKSLLSIYFDFLAPTMAKFNFAAYVLFSKWLLRRLNKFHNIKYLTKFNVVLVAVHEYSIREIAKFVVQIKKDMKKSTVFVTPCVPFEYIREALKSPENFKYFKILIDTCDAFLNWGHEAISDYLKLYTDTPVVNFPMTYPFEFAKAFFKKREEKEKIIFVPGHVLRVDDVASMLVARKIQEIYPDFVIEVLKMRGLNVEPLRGSNYRLRAPSPKWVDFLKRAGRAYMVIDMDNTWTLGRVPNDAAAVGTPCIGLNSGSQADLFPALTCSDIVGTRKAVKLGVKLIEDTKFYKRIQEGAFKKLERYSHENAEKRLSKLLENLRK